MEALWLRYQPYADGNFLKEFAKEPDERFWEMYLTVRLLDAGKRPRRRAELTRARRDAGPDICIRRGRRKIWIEAVTPGPGDSTNLDRVPDLIPASANGQVQDVRRQVELRITSVLLEKAEQFRTYREKGIVDERDSCVVAVSAGRFPLQAVAAGLPHAVTAVYPFGKEYFDVDRETLKFVGPKFEHSGEIERASSNGEVV